MTPTSSSCSSSDELGLLHHTGKKEGKGEVKSGVAWIEWSQLTKKNSGSCFLLMHY